MLPPAIPEPETLGEAVTGDAADEYGRRCYRKCPSRLRGRLAIWLLEVRAGVYVEIRPNVFGR